MAIPKWSILIFHNFIFWLYCLDFWYHIFLAFLPSKSTYAGEYKYLTIWCLICQLVYFALASIHDFLYYFDRRKAYYSKNFQDYVYQIAFPLAMMVSLVFWAIYAIDRELIFPAYLDDYIPAWHNNILHTCPAIFMFIDTTICYHKYQPMKLKILQLVTFISIYIIWLFWIRYVGGIWVYPIFYVLSTFGIALFLCGLTVFFIALSVLGQFINQYFWKLQHLKNNTQAHPHIN